jgi:hypothetical protein
MNPAWIRALDPTEAEAFAALRGHLASLWRDVFAHEDQRYTSVVVPSITLENSQLARMPEYLQYEEVLLFLLIRLRNPMARIVYVTSLPLPPLILDYYLQFLSGIPAPHAAARIRLVAAYDGSPRPLTQKILERPRLIARIRAAIFDPARAYLTVLRSTDLERRLAVRLGLPLNAADPASERLCAESSMRRLLAAAGIPIPQGVEDLRDEKDLLDAIVGLQRTLPSLRRAIVRLETSFQDEGHALVTLPRNAGRRETRAALRSARVSQPGDGPEAFLERFERQGGVLEEFVEAPHRADASVQLRINPLGQLFLTSTHDEVRGGPSGLDAWGCSFPAHDDYRRELQEVGLRIGGLLAERGVVSRLSIEFLLHRDRHDRPWHLLASKVNLGVGGSTHPLLAVRLLCDGALDPDSGLFRSPSGRLKFYRCTDRLVSEAYRQLTPEDIIELMTMHQLNYNAHTERGALLYMLGGVSATGRLGILAIGDSRREADAVFAEAATVLEAACPPPAP